MSHSPKGLALLLIIALYLVALEVSSYVIAHQFPPQNKGHFATLHRHHQPGETV